MINSCFVESIITQEKLRVDYFIQTSHLGCIFASFSKKFSSCSMQAFCAGFVCQYATVRYKTCKMALVLAAFAVDCWRIVHKLASFTFLQNLVDFLDTFVAHALKKAHCRDSVLKAFAGLR
jgi:hypothetical protein